MTLVATGRRLCSLKDAMIGSMLAGFVVAFIGAIPVTGPLEVIVFARGVAGDYRGALWLAFGASVVEAVYASMAFFATSFLARFAAFEVASRFIAAIVLVAIGAYFSHWRFTPPRARKDALHAARSFATGCALSVLNPILIVTWGTAITTLYGVGLVRLSRDVAFAFGPSIAAGMMAWFVTLMALLRRYRGRMPHVRVTRVVRCLGLFLIGLGVFGMFRAVQVTVH